MKIINKINFAIIYLAINLSNVGFCIESPEDLLMLNKDVVLKDLKKARVEMEGQDSNTYLYYSFKSSLKLEDFMKQSKILIHAKTEESLLGNFIDYNWIIPKLPKDVLDSPIATSIQWYKEPYVYHLKLAVVKSQKNANEFEYYICCTEDFPPTNGILPKLSFPSEEIKK